MDDPIKVIFKFKNDNRRTQYHTYIFIGDIPASLLSILKTIKDKTLLDTFLLLEEIDIKKLEKLYGAYWYKKFFNTYHMNYMISIIKKTPKYSKEISGKFGKDWYDTHIGNFIMVEKKIFYSYEKTISEERNRKDIRKKVKQTDDDKIIDFRTVIKPFNINDALKSKNMPSRITNKEKEWSSNAGSVIDGLFDKYLQENGVPEAIKQNGGTYEYLPNIDTYNIVQKGGKEEEEEVYDEYESTDDLDIEDLEKIYEDVYQDKHVSQTATMLKDALESEKAFKKEINSILDFDNSKNKNSNDEELKDVYEKQYITGQYIFKDDTIKMIKNKICCSIKNNEKFGKHSYLMPSRQYLFSEYVYDDILEKVMLGQKWVRRNDLLKIDIEPTSLTHYEDLRGNLKSLKESVKRYGSKIKWEDDDYNILYDYEGYYTNNEVYLMDIYNELGTKYNPDPEVLKNVTDVYINIYYRRIKSDDIKNIINYLNGSENVEASKMSAVYSTINNDLILEKYVMNDVEMVKRTNDYKKLFKENFITQSVIHVNLRVKDNTRINLYRIFNEFVTTSKYPFIQYQTQDGQINFKYSESDINNFSSKKNNTEVLAKWFENAPYGISFKVQIVEGDDEKFMVINLNEMGKVEYKTRWKEDDTATMLDIVKTYDHIRNLLRKINEEKNKTIFELPEDEEFKYAFINSIQRFALPDNFIINHNDLSEFSRYFFPYVSLVIEPRKRQSKTKKINNKSKFGTYLRFKRMSKYENSSRIEQRILYFMKHYDHTEQTLANEISKQFNLTMEKATESIDKVKEKYPNVKKSRKILKKLENIPKYKPPGIGIDIQGKQADRYKIRISGARNKAQLDRIIQFMNILIFMYMETYLMKKPERQKLKDKLIKLTNIAQRRNKVEIISKPSEDTKSVKLITSYDKNRLGFKPEKGQNQWTRSCQNSGNEKRRRPTLYTSVDELLSEGYKLNKTTGIYEKTYRLKIKGKMQEVTVRAVGLHSSNDPGSEDDEQGMIYYSCNPKDNGDHTFIGFLSRSNNPFGQSMPCCFKKDPFLSANKGKKDLYLKSLGKEEKIEALDPKATGEQLYILQDTNKIQEGRFGILPKYLDTFINQALGNERILKQHNLIKTNGYYFKYGTKQDENHFLIAVATIYNSTIDELKQKIINALEKDKGDSLFTALNNGDIREKFKTRENYITFIKIGKNLSYDIINHIISIPNVISKNGINILIFNKETIIIKKTLEKEKVREDFTILCQNSEETNNIRIKERDCIMMLKEDKHYYPIVKTVKKGEEHKTIDVTKIFKYNDDKANIINHISDFYIRSCERNYIADIKNENQITAKHIYKILEGFDKDYNVKYQVIDAKYKTKYFVTNNDTIIPTKPSGSIYDVPIKTNLVNRSFKVTVDSLQKLFKASKEQIPVNPVGVYVEFSNDLSLKSEYQVIAIVTNNNSYVPIIMEVIKRVDLEKMNFNIITKELYDKIDKEIEKNGATPIIDDRVSKIKHDKFFNESYELFRLELSNFLSSNEKIKMKIIKTISTKTSISSRMHEVRRILYKIVDKKLFNLFTENVVQKGGSFVTIVNELPNIIKYDINNNRDICKNNNKDTCTTNLHCKWTNDSCKFAITNEMAIRFINKVSDELVNNQLKAYEILNLDNYFVSDIVDFNIFTTRPNQKIIKSTNTSMNKFLTELFGKDNIPQIGKRRVSKIIEDSQEMNIKNPLRDMGNFFIQKVMDNNVSTLRAYANGYNWIKNAIYDINTRNLKYYSVLQTDYASFFKSLIIDWLNDINNEKLIVSDIIKYIKKDYEAGNVRKIIIEFVNKFGREVSTVSNGIVEYYVINKIFNIPIVVYDDSNAVIYIFDNGIVYDKFSSKKVPEKYAKNLSSMINIKFTISNAYSLPSNIEVFYYKE